MTEWTAETKRIVRDHYLTGRSPGWIAQELGSTTAAIKMLLSRMGVKRGTSVGTNRAPRKPRLKEADIATRLAVLLGEAVRPPAPRRHIPDEDLLRYAGERTPPEAAAALWDWIKP